MLCLVMGRPLMDLGYFPIQLRVIDYVSRKENRNSYAYIFVHEFALYLGRFFGCGLFIVLTICLSDTFAIRYALLIIGIIQLVSIGISRNIIRGARQGRGGIGYPARGQEGQPRTGTMRRGSVAAGGYRPGLCPGYGGPARIGNAAAAERLRFALL